TVLIKLIRSITLLQEEVKRLREENYMLYEDYQALREELKELNQTLKKMQHFIIIIALKNDQITEDLIKEMLNEFRTSD
ncbi:MAG: cell division protein ZapB, partial [Sulfurihydrogenibium azorense]